ncbi:MAG: PEGA domain-containing protein, partial [Methanophagales archaeon]|nr:PEGA domain-containing protein [Methanophagales archaeon]
DGSYKGKTPKTITGASAGSHTIKLSKSGYNDYTRTTSVIAGETKRINLNLRQATGSISVTSSPSGASVYLDGSLKGKTPKTITGVSAGSHTIKLSESGYIDYTRTTSVKAGETKQIYAKLVRH